VKAPVLIVGGDARLGRALAEALEAEGVDVWRTLRRGPPAARVIAFDLRDPELPLPAGVRFGHAVLCAGLTAFATCEADPVGSAEVNVAGTLRVAKALLDRGIPLTFLSSDAAAGAAPATEYGRQKAAVEAALLAEDGGRDLVTICRLAKVLAPELPLIAGWVETLRAGGAVEAFGDRPLAPLSLPFAVAALGGLIRDRLPGCLHLTGRPTNYAALARGLALALGQDPGRVRATAQPPGAAPFTPLAPGPLELARGWHPQDLADVVRELVPPSPARPLAARAHAHREAGRFAEALAAFDAALTADPTRRELQLEAGELLFRLNRSEEALARWFALGDLAPQGDFDAAVEAWRFRSLVPLDPMEARVRVAEACLGATRFEDAFALWEQVFAAHPEWAVVHRRFTAAFLFCGRVAEADRIFQATVDHHGAKGRAAQLDRLGIRFLREYSTNVGHIGFLDHYVKAGYLGRRAAATPIVLHGRKPVANPCFLTYWHRHLPNVIADADTYGRLEPFIDALEDHTHGYLDAWGRVVMAHAYGDYVEVFDQWEREGRAPLLSLDPDHLREGEAALRAMGLPEGAWYVGLHVREDRWDRVRNAPIATYLPAIQAITERGGWVIRMGDAGMTPLPALPQVVDYAHGPQKSDRMDVFLWATNRFFLGTQSGPCQGPAVFGKPCVLTNWAPLLFPILYGSDLGIFKRYRSKREGRTLGFAELMASGLGFISSAAYLDHLGVDVEDNSPEEIREAVLEMLARLEGRLEADTPWDAQAQAAWRACYRELGGTNGRLGRGFARRHPGLLGLEAAD
jgi:putative glycosyltransferase (TIGR04372 family)